MNQSRITKALSLMVACALVLGLAACGGPPDSSSAPDASQSATSGTSSPASSEPEASSGPPRPLDGHLGQLRGGLKRLPAPHRRRGLWRGPHLHQRHGRQHAREPWRRGRRMVLRGGAPTAIPGRSQGLCHHRRAEPAAGPRYGPFPRHKAGSLGHGGAKAGGIRRRRLVLHRIICKLYRGTRRL